jgi:hypothetical protein
MLAGLTFEICEVESTLAIPALLVLEGDVVALEFGPVFSLPPPHAESINRGSKKKQFLKLS